jgi:hypothetical protein
MLLDGQEDEEAREVFLEELYDDGKSEETALEQLRRHMGWEEGDIRD